MTYKDPSELSDFGRWCLDHKLSQRDIAGLIGRSRQMVNRYWVDDGEVPQIVQIMFYEMWDLLPEKTRRTLLERFPAQ